MENKCAKIDMRCTMVFDGFFLYNLINELNQDLSKSRLEKIYQTDDMTFVFVFYLKGKRMQLKLDVSPFQFGMYLTHKKTLVTITTQFLASIKKHLEGAILNEIIQRDSDRVAIFDFTVFDYIDGPIQKLLIFEAMGKHSNLILVKDDLIIETFKKMFFEEGRQLLPMAHFEYFPTDKKPFFDIDYSDITSPKDIVDRYMGVSPFLAKHLYDTKSQITDLKLKPTKVVTTGKSYALDLFEDKIKVYYDTLSQMLDDHEEKKVVNFTSHQQFIEKQIAKLERKLEQSESLIAEANEMLTFKEKGDLLYSSQCDLSEKRTDLTLGDLRIILDPLKTVNENAQRFYKLYQKAKRTLNHIEKQDHQTNELLDLFQEFKTYLSFSDAEQVKDIEKELIEFGYKPKQKQSSKKTVSRPLITKLNFMTYHIYIGKNSTQNAFLTHEVAKKEDYWFHVKNAPGAHIVVSCEKLNEEIIRTSAMLAAHFSSMKYSSSIPVDYTQIKYVKKISGKPGYQVSYSKEQTIYIDIDEEKIEFYLKKV